MGTVISKCKSVSPGSRRTKTEQQRQQQQLQQQQEDELASQQVNDRSYMAIHNFEATQSDELSIRKGDILEIQLDAEARERTQWWPARNLESNRSGTVPYNYVTKYTGMPCLLNGWMDVNRMDANRMLLRAGLQPGTYIVRPCAKPTAKLALSVRTPDRQRENNFLVKHYQIKNSTDGTMFFINRNKTHPTVQRLIDEYKNGGLCSPLTDPCPIDPPVVQFKDIEVNRDTLNMLRKLGAGSFGEVLLAKWNGILDVAVKTLKTGTMTPESFLGEAKLMHKLCHPKIVNILGVCSELRSPDDQILIITEFMENGSLLDYLKKHANGPDRILMPTLLDMAYQIADGMAYLEEKRFVHRDLRAANVLVGKDNFVKVADFGLARVVQEDSDAYAADPQGKFPVKWTAPEAMYENKFTTKSDVWSFGVLLYEILTCGGAVYAGMANREVMNYVKDPRNRLPIPRTAMMSEEDVKTASRIHETYMTPCWKPNPDDRPTFVTLRNELEDIDKALEQQYQEN